MEYSIKNIKTIIGLGNPGTKYYKTRHSIGFRILDKIAQDYNVSWSNTDLMEHTKISLTVDGLLQPIILIKPLTYMNDSGKVVPYLQKKGIKPENILVVHDELEKAFGKLSIKFAGSARGHNGLRSIIGSMGYDFWRFRFGIGRPDNKMDVGNFVLTNFNAQEELDIENLLQESVQKIFQE